MRKVAIQGFCFINQDAHGPAVTDDVVHCNQFHMALPAQPQKSNPEQWTPAKVEPS